MTEFEIKHGLSQDAPGPLEPVELAQQPGAAPATGNTARDQEMYAAGLEMGEANAKHNAAIRAAAGWLPIESAPKTGRTLLLGYWNSHGKWRTVRGQWMSAEYIGQEWEDPDDVEAGWFETAVEADDVPNCWRIEPSHWQPLPAAPGAPASPISTGEQGDAPYCYALETRGRHAGEDDVLLDVEYNGTDSFSGGRTGGIPLYRRPAPAAGDAQLPNIDVEAAAKVLAECMDYPWAHMPEQGRAHMREHAQSVIRAGLSAAQRQGDAR